MSQYFLKVAEKKKFFKVYEDDVFVCSFPRSGTTMTQEMTWLIMNDFNFDLARSKILDKRSPTLEYDEVIQQVYGDGEIVDSFEKLPRPRVIKTHLPIQLLPDDYWKKNPKTIYISRDVKDVVVSNYEMCKNLRNYKNSIEEFVEDFMNDRVLSAPYREHVAGYKSLNILNLTYEELTQKTEETIVKVADYLGKPVSDENVAKLLEHLKFDSMKSL
jgi:sulfotransferase